MKISHIHIENFLGARAVDIDLAAPVALIAGPNAAGKSSVRDAVALALTADLGRVGIKKDAPQLITDGAEGATVVLQTSAGEVGVAISASGRIADSLKGVELPAALPYVLDGQRFARMTPEDRRGFLFGLMNLSASGQEVRKRLAARDCDEKRVEAVLPMLRAGFDAAAKEASTKAREAKAAWREITGEAYGEKKAEGWAPPAVAFDEEQLQEATEALDAIEAELAKANTELGALLEQQRHHQAAHQRITGVRERAERRGRIVEKLERDRAELAEWEQKLSGVKAAAEPRVGLVHELGWALNNLVMFGDSLDPEKPDDKRVLDALAAYIAEYGKITEPTAHDVEMAGKLPAYVEARDLMKRSVANGERDLADADAAAAELAALQSVTGQPVDEAALTRARGAVEHARAERAARAAKVQQLCDAERAQRQAGEKRERAANAHRSVLAWTAIADALSPGGIPGEILTEALDPLNERLQQSALSTEWMQVGVDGEMQISVGSAGRPYALLSESEKWRVDAMLAEAITHLSGLRMLVLDRMDVLDLQGRSDLLGWLDELAEVGELETALVFATLKALPGSLPPTIYAHWIENGVVAQLKEAA